mmetsp:Transcript_80902/g.229079  ORF Transcript_80902/g.229079 Transcript_80902/m.229079 type:complete len:262 (-) Transcript_80902:1792-2577(-)
MLADERALGQPAEQPSRRLLAHFYGDARLEHGTVGHHDPHPLDLQHLEVAAVRAAQRVRLPLQQLAPPVAGAHGRAPPEAQRVEAAGRGADLLFLLALVISLLKTLDPDDHLWQRAGLHDQVPQPVQGEVQRGLPQPAERSAVRRDRAAQAGVARGQRLRPHGRWPQPGIPQVLPLQQLESDEHLPDHAAAEGAPVQVDPLRVESVGLPFARGTSRLPDVLVLADRLTQVCVLGSERPPALVDQRELDGLHRRRAAMQLAV